MHDLKNSEVIMVAFINRIHKKFAQYLDKSSLEYSVELDNLISTMSKVMQEVVSSDKEMALERKAKVSEGIDERSLYEFDVYRVQRAEESIGANINVLSKALESAREYIATEEFNALPDGLRSYLDIIIKEGPKALALMDKTMSKTEEYSMWLCDVDTLIENIVGSFRARYPEVDFRLNISGALKRPVLAYAGIIEKTLDELKKAAGTGAFGSIIGKAADLRTQLTLQEARLKKLYAETESFQVLPEYRELEVESAKLTRQLNELANANTIDFAAIRDLEGALASEIPPDLEDLQAVYLEAGIALPGLVKRRYEDVKSFHQSVVRNRKDYLSSELEAAKLRIELRDSKKAQLDQRRAEIMGILRSHGALEQFLKLQGELGRLESEVESLRQRFEAAEQLEGTKNELEIERNRLTIRLRRDFAEQNDRLAEAIVAFEETSQRLYESAGSMTVDETSNGPMFKFPMQGQRSKGIKNMQIFCFDMMLMRLCVKRQIGPRFLIHDSHLFDGVDGRQVISALRLGSEISQELGFQYIVTMNEDDAFKETVAGFDLNDHVLSTRLTDATDDGGLFGIRFG